MRAEHVDAGLFGDQLAQGAAGWRRATIDFLATQRWEAVTVDAMANASGVHRTTIYRRWGSRNELVVARAVQRGEAPAGTDPLALGRTLSAPLLTRALVTGEDIDDNAAAEAAGIAAAAIRSGALIPQPSPLP